MRNNSTSFMVGDRFEEYIYLATLPQKQDVIQSQFFKADFNFSVFPNLKSLICFTIYPQKEGVLTKCEMQTA